jgi:hypothetical protein
MAWSGGVGSAQQASGQSSRPTNDRVRERFSPADFERFVEKERKGEIRSQSGPVVPAQGRDRRLLSASDLASASEGAYDALGNNNAGATGTANFTQSETSILAFGNNVVLGFNDSGSNAGGANKFTGFALSTDGGVTFTDGGTLPTNPGGDAGDPVLARNESTGRIYFSTLGFSASTIQVFRSDDNGFTWMPPVNGTPGGSSEDKEWMAVDNFPGSGNGNVYLMSRRFGSPAGIYMFRSTDHGSTFGPTGGTLIVTGQQGAFVTVGPDHAVYALWWNGATIQMRKSTDQGVIFGAPVTVASGLTGGTNGDLGLTGIRQGTSTPASFRSNSFPHAAVNPVSGHLYVVFNDNPAGADKGDIYLVTSTDGGATWSARVRVNDDATTTDQWQPTIAVTPEGTGIGIFYYSRQEDPANNLFRFYGRTGIISGSTVTFTPSFPISDVPSLPEFGRDAVVNSTYMGDYDFAVAAGGRFHVTWADNRDDLPGGAPRKDPNIYYDSVAAGLLPGPNISVSPATVDFGPVAVTATASRAITVVNIGDAPLTVSAITSPAPDFSLTAPALPAVIPSLGSITLTAAFSPTSLGAQSSSFTVTSDAANTPVVTVNLTGTGATNISVAPASIDFGTVPVGQSAGPTAVTIRNTGGVSLTISALTAPGGDFSVTPISLPAVLPPNGTATVNVSFAPTAPGPQTSSFDILSDAIGTPAVTVSLQGLGIVPPPNDLCSDAIPLSCGASIEGTTVLATFDNVGTCGTSNTAPGVWYTVSGTGQPVTVSTCTAASYDTKISVFSGSCGALTCVGGNDDACGLRSSVTFNSVAGETYFVLVHGFLSATGTFTLTTSQCPAEIAVAPEQLTFAVPLNGTDSAELTIANIAEPGAADLLWRAYSVDGAPAAAAGAEATVDAQALARFEITGETIAALNRRVPTAIRRGLERLIGEPTRSKDEFIQLLNDTIGEANVSSFYLLIMENAVTFQGGLKDAPDADGMAAGGPDGFGYEFIDSDTPGGPTFGWVDITGTGTPVTLTDDSSILVPLPFAFPFYGVAKTEVRISSNGYLTFGTSGSTFTNTSIPNTLTPNDIIAPFWDDLNPAAGGTVHYLSSPTQFIVQYTNIRRFATTQPNTFQVIMNADGSMLFQYLDMQGLLTSATVGIENASGTTGLQVVFNAAYVHNNLAVRLSLPPQCPWIPSIAPSSGTLPAGESTASTVSADAATLPIGIYECLVRVRSNAANAGAIDVPVTLITGSPVQRINDLIRQVRALRAAGVLNDGQAQSFIAKLQAARANLGRANTGAAINELRALINEINAYVQAGILTPEQGQDLIADVQVIIGLLEG